ncbi:MAG: hypothetical protein L0H53_16765, partial [Candidatus Nitrosocosmicus sp.]|nr:hypothetical protein [Candidatus Nitrosocosmicus sp.]
MNLFLTTVITKSTITITAALLLSLSGGSTLVFQVANAVMDPGMDFSSPRAPIATSEGDNVYIAWMTDNSMPNSNAEIIFRASNNGGETFGEKINLSNSSNIDSVDQEIAAEGDYVFVTWWERNSTNNTPVLRISNDNGETFGPQLLLANNGT